MKNIIISEPTTIQRPKSPLLLALHGNLGSAEASLNYWQPATSLGWLLAMPQSTRMDDDGNFIWNHPASNEWPVEEIQTHYNNLQEQYPIDAEQVILGGFSMGAGLAIWMALHGHIKTRGFIAVAPYLPYEYVEAPKMNVAASINLRGYVIVGKQDDPTYGFAIKFVARLGQIGIACELVSYPNLEHEYPPDFATALLRGLDYVSPLQK